MTADTLDPRPDIGDAGRRRCWTACRTAPPPLRLLDFGTGTGCLLLALLHELPNATGLGVDVSAAALAVAHGECERARPCAARATFRSRRLGRRHRSPRFDIVISNPPYIRAATIAGLQPEVARFEPRLALDGGADGLDAYRSLAPAAARLLAPGGLAAFEIGLGQGDSVRGDHGRRPGCGILQQRAIWRP